MLKAVVKMLNNDNVSIGQAQGDAKGMGVGQLCKLTKKLHFFPH